LYKDDRPSVEVGVLAAGPFDGGGFVVSSELPGGRAATAIHRGDHAQLGRTHEAILRFIEEQGFQRAGPRWEIYGHWREDPRELATEIYARRRWPAQSSARRRPRRVRGRSRPGRGRSRDGEPMPLLAPVTTAILSLSRRFMIAATQRQPSAT
jgi:hypothetical protein